MVSSGASADEWVGKVVEGARRTGTEVAVCVVHEVSGKLSVSPASDEIVGDLRCTI